MGRKSRKQKTPGQPDHDPAGRRLATEGRYAPAAVCCFLLLAVLMVFCRTAGYGFVSFDDKDYVYENRHISDGLTAESAAWAFGTMHAGNWHPLTWLSHILDCQFYGSWAGGHHLTNVLLHAATAALLFLVLRRMTGGLWPSAFVAAIFAIHPLRVESVAWVAERKDVLSGLCFVLVLAAYLAYVRRPFSWGRYLTVAAMFALGLMAKPMLVTLPFVLLLLDYWPLGRLCPVEAASSTGSQAPVWEPQHGVPKLEIGNQFRMWRLVAEKLPLVLMSAASCVVTSLAQRQAAADLDSLPLWSRLANAAISYAAYLGQFFFPSRLAMLYPRAGRELDGWLIAGSVLLLASISLAIWAGRKTCPYLLVGWLWYLGMLVPVIGLVQVGRQSMADRYTYLPQIGLAIGLAWGARQILVTWPWRTWVYGVCSALLAAVLMGCAWGQVSYWHDTETMWRHTLACTTRNAMAHSNLGVVLREQGRLDEAIDESRKALAIEEGNFLAHNTLGVALCEQGNLAEAIDELHRAIEIKPDCADAHNNLGVALTKQGKVDEAMKEYEIAISHDENCVESHVNLGAILYDRGRAADAIPHYLKALDVDPRSAEAHNNLGNALVAIEKDGEAIAEYRKAIGLKGNYAPAHYNLAGALYKRGAVLEATQHWAEVVRLQPRHVPTLNRLAWVLATNPDASIRNGPQAVRLAQQCAELTGNRDPSLLDTLAAAYAETGQFRQAAQTARRALDRAAEEGQPALADLIRAKIPLYEAGTPFRDVPRSPVETPTRP